MSKLLLILILFSPVVAQESNVRLVGEVQVAAGYGYRNPQYGLSVGAAKAFGNRVVLDVSGRFLRARKIPGDGYHLRGTVELRVMVSEPVFVLGGVSLTRQFTNYYEKVGTDPFVGVGYRTRDGRTFITGRVIGNDWTTLSQWQARARPADLNFHRRVGFAVGAEHYFSKRLYLSERFAITRFDCFTGPTGGPTAVCSGAIMNFGVGVYR